MKRKNYLTKKFEHDLKKIKDFSFLEHVKKQMEKIINNPEIGKPLKYQLFGEHVVRIKPYRLIYSYTNDAVYFLRLRHRKKVYKK